MFGKKILTVPEEHTEELMKLIDINKDSTENKYINRRNIWKKIREILPETNIGSWQFSQYGDQIKLIQLKKKITWKDLLEN